MRKKPWRIVIAIAVVAIVATGCASGDDTATDGDGNQVSGIVTEVTGDLTAVDSFVILDDNGDSHLFRPEPGLLFYGGPLTHLRDHVVTGQRVTVTFEDGVYGETTATLVVHEDESEPHNHSDHGG